VLDEPLEIATEVTAAPLNDVANSCVPILVEVRPTVSAVVDRLPNWSYSVTVICPSVALSEAGPETGDACRDRLWLVGGQRTRRGGDGGRTGLRVAIVEAGSR
jgi:hypothetical protein